MLTNAAVKGARASARPYKLCDTGGLYLYVTPTGRRTWRMKFRYQGREKLLTFGPFPTLSLVEARARRDAARAMLKRGEYPASQECKFASGAMQICTFEHVARSWHADRRPRWTDRHAADVLASLERDIFPELGAMAITDIDAAAVLAAIQSIEARGAHETARRVRQRIDMIFGFAIARQLVDRNPAAAIARELAAAPATRRHPAITDIDEARALLAATERAGGPPVIRLASRFLALTAVRIGALIGATWDEIEDLDGPAPLWRVPAERMKLKKARKADRANDHLVPLSAAAVTVLRQVRAFDVSVSAAHAHQTALSTAGDRQIFPIRPAAIGALYDRAGWRGRHVPHGWRATFATILNEAMPEERFVIDQALAHSPKEKVEAAYNRAAQLARRRRLFDAWGEMLVSQGQ